MIESMHTAVCDYCGEELSPYDSENEAKQSVIELGWEIDPEGRWLKCYRCVDDEDEDEE